MAKGSSHDPDTRLAGHATDAPELSRRIADMEKRLMVERAQVVAHAREFRGNVRRRIASPINLLFAGSFGYVAAEIISARSAATREAIRHGDSKAQQKAARKSVLGPLIKPLLSLLHVGSMGFLAKQGREVVDSARAVSEASGSASTLH